MSVTVPAAVVREEEQRAAKQLASRANLKGFRKGRVPTRVIESRFSGALRREALDKLVADAYRQALTTEKLSPISQGEIEDVKYEPQRDLTFQVTFDVQPVIEIGRLGGFVVERPVPEVKDEHVQAVLERVREQNGAWRPVEAGRPENGDLVSVKILRLDGAPTAGGGGSDAEERDYDFVLGQGDAIPEIEASIETLEPGGSSEFTITFPEDLAEESSRGQGDRVQITLVGRKVLDLPPLDDDLAKQVGDFESLEDLKAKVRADMEKEAVQRAESAVRGRLLDFLLEANAFEVPGSMVDRYVDSFIGDARNVPQERVDEARRQIRPEAERAVKRILLLDRVAEMQGLAATEEDIDARVEEIAAANDTTPAKVYASMQKAGRLESLERELTEKKVFEFLEQQSEIQ